MEDSAVQKKNKEKKQNVHFMYLFYAKHTPLLWRQYVCVCAHALNHLANNYILEYMTI